MEKFDKKIEQKLSSYPEEGPSEASVQKMLSKLDEGLPQADNVRTFSNYNMIYRLAASFALIAMMGYGLFVWSVETVTTPKGSQAEVLLPDGSRVQLNADSELEYNKLLWYFDRKVALTGEAFFEVEKGEQFEVDSKYGITQVLGTSFNISAREKTYEVKCYTGKVGVKSKTTAEQVVLQPGEGVTMNVQAFQSFEFDVTNDGDWRQGVFYFDEESFGEVIAELERQFGIKINYPASYANISYTGYFANKDLATALKLVCEPVGLESQQGDRIIELTPIK